MSQSRWEMCGTTEKFLDTCPNLHMNYGDLSSKLYGCCKDLLNGGGEITCHEKLADQPRSLKMYIIIFGVNCWTYYFVAHQLLQPNTINYYFRKVKTKNNNTKTARMPISEGSCCPRIRSFWKRRKKNLKTSSTIFWPRLFIDSIIFVTVEFQFAQRVSNSVESFRETSLFSPFSLLILA